MRMHTHAKIGFKLDFCAKTELRNSRINSWELPGLHCNDSILPLVTLIKAAARVARRTTTVISAPVFNTDGKTPLERNWIILNSKGLKSV